MKRKALLALLLLAPLAVPVAASDKDHDAALRAVKAGEIRPLTEIMEIVRPHLQGEVVKVEAERHDGIWVYELRVVGADGRRADVYVDGKTAKILRVKRK